MTSINAALVIVCLKASTVQAHELWFQPSGETAAFVRPTFGDSPAPGEARRGSKGRVSLLPPYRLADEGRRIDGLPGDRTFTVAEAAGAAM